MFVRKAIVRDPVRERLNEELKQYVELYQRWNKPTYRGCIISKMRVCNLCKPERLHTEFYAIFSNTNR